MFVVRFVPDTQILDAIERLATKDYIMNIVRWDYVMHNGKEKSKNPLFLYAVAGAAPFSDAFAGTV